jgi:hypothetical protein
MQKSPATRPESNGGKDSLALTGAITDTSAASPSNAAPVTSAENPIMDSFTTAARKKMGLRSTILTGGLNTAITANKALTGV